jgi:hypothetical protein
MAFFIVLVYFYNFSIFVLDRPDYAVTLILVKDSGVFRLPVLPDQLQGSGLGGDAIKSSGFEILYFLFLQSHTQSSPAVRFI